MLAPAANSDAVPRLSPRKREQVREQATTRGKDNILEQWETVTTEPGWEYPTGHGWRWLLRRGHVEDS